MSTPAGRGNMRRLPENSRARRRLFAEGPNDHAEMDNFANVFLESCLLDRTNMMKKYNFDMTREVPLEGDFDWYRKDKNTWIGIKPETPKPETVLEDKFVPIEKENQMTPKVATVESAPEVRKRKRDGCISTVKGAKRKISFD